MRTALLAVLIILSATSLGFSQSRIVRGIVTSSEDGGPIPGVTILIRGTTQGTITDVDGQYEISVPADKK
jgi:hypothetical protein